ncbi:rab11 family-interacting protein 3 [Brachionichthys hirsutus]|uniref:rab11 family-interacting protein 3 n=1 Tax=Brachionichthys hirsutus TaxID=412623 RepID=UPI0036046F9D
MEQPVLSRPPGRTQWDSEQPFPLGFHTLDSDGGGVASPNKTGQTGLDFRSGDQDHTSLQNEAVSFIRDESVKLENFKNLSDFSFCNLDFKGKNSAVSSASREELFLTENPEKPEEISDCTLSWLVSPQPADVTGKNTPCEELILTRQNPLEGSNGLRCHGEVINISVPVSPLKIAESVTGDAFLLVDLSSENSRISPELSADLKTEVVGEEVAGLSQEEQTVRPPSERRETLSRETGDKGLFPDQVTDLSAACSATLQGLPEIRPLPGHVGAPLECFEGTVPLLDLEVPDFAGSLSLCPVSPPPVFCTGVLSDSPTEEPEVQHAAATVTKDLTSQRQGENDALLPSLSAEPPSLTSPLDEDVFIRGGFVTESHSGDNEPKGLMEDIIFPESKPQGNETIALGPFLDPDEVHGGDTLHSKTKEGLEDGDVHDQTTGQRDEETLMDANQLEQSDHRAVASFEFSVQDLETSAPEAGWTSEQTVETVSISEMVADDTMPAVSAVDRREEDVSPLKAVFDALDQDGDGFVRIEEFMEFAAAYGADQVKDLTKFLDPSGLGVISFEDFHRGISAISNGGPEPQLYGVNYSPGDGAVGCAEEYDEQNEVTDSAYLGSESTYSECETFTDEDTGALVPPEMHEEVETDSGIEATLHDPEDHGNRFSLNSELHHHQPAVGTVIGGEEEHFEDFGENNSAELLLESVVESAEGRDNSPLVSPQQLNGSSLLSPNAGKRLSSKKVARHLLQNSSMTLDTMSDLTRDILELADNDITDKVLLLERRVAELEKESEASGEQHARLRQENLHLVHRANALEEQLKEQEIHAEEQLQQESRRQKEALIKLERERGLELENLQARLQQLDEENGELRSCVPCLRANIERLEEEKRKLQDETEAVSDRLQEETESRRKMADRLSHERHQSQKEKESTQELIEDLRKQLEHLQLYKLEAEAKRGRTPGAGLQEYQTRTREAELEQEIKRLKQDNRSLKEQNDELNGQIINLSIQGAKNLMSASFSDSLAAEINSVSRTELMGAIHKQEEINYRLQDYIDKIIVAIMESNPSMLEVK